MGSRGITVAFTGNAFSLDEFLKGKNSVEKTKGPSLSVTDESFPKEQKIIIPKFPVYSFIAPPVLLRLSSTSIRNLFECQVVATIF
jgi:hypothetical protein